MSGDPFEFPQHLRKLTESNVELARAAYAQFVEALTQATDVCLNSIPQNEMTAGLKVAQGQLIRFGKQNVEAGLNLASDLANAKSLPNMLDIQTAYAQTQIHVLAYQAQQLARLMAKVGWNLQPRR
jgi:hypothetical protein